MTRLRTIAQLCLTIAMAFAATSVSAQTVGYTARASGFDLNFNGTVGQTGSADVAVCDGQGNQSSTTGEDVDGNGVNDRQVYVDLTSGSDSLSCGLPGAPCRTITYAMNGSNTAVSGGPIQAPAAAQIQAICFKGIGRETIVPTQSGATGTYTLPADGQSGTFVSPAEVPVHPQRLGRQQQRPVSALRHRRHRRARWHARRPGVAHRSHRELQPCVQPRVRPFHGEELRAEPRRRSGLHEGRAGRRHGIADLRARPRTHRHHEGDDQRQHERPHRVQFLHGTARCSTTWRS